MTGVPAACTAWARARAAGEAPTSATGPGRGAGSAGTVSQDSSWRLARAGPVSWAAVTGRTARAVMTAAGVPSVVTACRVRVASGLTVRRARSVVTRCVGGMDVQAGEGEREPDRGIGRGGEGGGVQGGVEQGGVDLVSAWVGAVGEGGFGVPVCAVLPGGGQAPEGGSVVESGGGQLLVEAVEADRGGGGRRPGAGPVPVPVLVVVGGGGGGAGGVAGPRRVAGAVWSGAGGLGVDGQGAVAAGCGGSGGDVQPERGAVAGEGQGCVQGEFG